MQKISPRVVVCIPCHNQGHLVKEAIHSAFSQEYDNLHVVALDDASTDGTIKIFDELSHVYCKFHYFRSNEPSGTGGSFNKTIEYSKLDYISADFIVLLCSDDVFTNKYVVKDIIDRFNRDTGLVHISRYYHQFIDGDSRPVRAWRCNDVIELANNPSGLAFRASALEGCELSNKMFVEAASLVSGVIQKGRWDIIPWDTIAVRIHQSISRNKDYYLKRWISSPVKEWANVGGSALSNDFTSLIQIKNYFTSDAVIKECINFTKVKPINIINPAFWFFSIVAIFTPRSLLRHVPEIYRRTWGIWTTRVVKRPQ